jgi:hypothetical protein
MKSWTPLPHASRDEPTEAEIIVTHEPESAREESETERQQRWQIMAQMKIVSPLCGPGDRENG